LIPLRSRQQVSRKRPEITELINPQQNITLDSIPTPSKPWPTANPAAAGPFEVEADKDVGPLAGVVPDPVYGNNQQRFNMYRPKNLATSGYLHPILIWANGYGDNAINWRAHSPFSFLSESIFILSPFECLFNFSCCKFRHYNLRY